MNYGKMADFGESLFQTQTSPLTCHHAVFEPMRATNISISVPVPQQPHMTWEPLRSRKKCDTRLLSGFEEVVPAESLDLKQS